MKLNAKYLPTQTAIETNPVYLHIQSLVVGMTSDFPISRPCYLFEKGMLVHEFSDMDRDFYDALYSPTRPLESDANVFFSLYPCLQDRAFGENEYDIAMFAADPLHQMGNVNSICVIAPVGHGKTTLLRYVLTYLRSLDPHLSESMFPIMLDCHYFREQLAARAGNPGELQDFVESKMLLPELTRICSGYTNAEQEDFWRWYKQYATSDLALREHDLSNLEPNTTTARRAVLAARVVERAHPDFPYHAARYLTQCAGRSIVVVVDNADPLPLDVQRCLLWFVKGLEGRAGIKVIFSVRDVTYHKLLRDAVGALPDLIVEWRATPVPDIIGRRLRYLQGRVGSHYGNNPIEINGKRLPTVTVEAIVEHMVDLIASEEVLMLIVHLSLRNIRDQMKLLRLLLESGAILERIAHSAAIAAILKTPPSFAKALPDYVAVGALISKNHYTFHSSIVRRVPGVLNLYCCSGVSTPWGNLTRLMLVSHLARHRGVGYERLENLLGHVREVFASVGDYPAIVEACELSLVRMLAKGLVMSPDVYDVRSTQDLRSHVEEVALSDLGHYYLDHLGLAVDYLFLVKDDVELDSTRDLRDAFDCHQRSIDKTADPPTINAHKRLRLNLLNTTAFFRRYGEGEVRLLGVLKAQQVLTPYLRHFAPVSGGLFSVRVLGSLRDFATVRLEDTEAAGRAKEALDAVWRAAAQQGIADAVAGIADG